MFNTLFIIFQSFGVITFFSALIPPLLDVYKTNKTYGISEKFMYFAMIAGFLFALSGFINIIEGITKSQFNTLFFLGIFMFVSNLSSLIVNFYFYKKKLINLKQAQAESLSEMDWYNKHYSSLKS